MTMKLLTMLNSFGCALVVIAILGGLPALASPVHADASDKGRRNVLFITIWGSSLRLTHVL